MNIENNSTLGKSRDIPITAYYTNLQLEYIGCKLRSEIYTRDFDKKKYSDICKGKKEKIENISTRNCLPSIFTSESSREKYIGKFFNEWGLPNFMHRDDHKRVVEGKWDQIYYFAEGVSVRIRTQKGDVKMGRITDFDYKSKMVTVDCGDDVMICDSCNVARILSNDFFNFDKD